MKWYKDPVIWCMILSVACGIPIGMFIPSMLGWTYTKREVVENFVPVGDVEALMSKSYRYGKQVARDDCRRVRDKEEENAPK